MYIYVYGILLSQRFICFSFWHHLVLIVYTLSFGFTHYKFDCNKNLSEYCSSLTSKCVHTPSMYSVPPLIWGCFQHIIPHVFMLFWVSFCSLENFFFFVQICGLYRFVVSTCNPFILNLRVRFMTPPFLLIIFAPRKYSSFLYTSLKINWSWCRSWRKLMKNFSC